MKTTEKYKRFVYLKNKLNKKGLSTRLNLELIELEKDPEIIDNIVFLKLFIKPEKK
jgi:hypothetical protein